ncbi:MAG: hypothetical protein JW919_07030 [Candidatus Omnitrophica bacterium]|nr:hypothetical protein [Candidatus Omnitrophota bacterium]
MKNAIWVIAVLMIAGVFLLEFRYAIVVNTPIVAKFDRLTGDVWIVNSGTWIKVRSIVEQEKEGPAKPAPAPQAKPAQGK